MSRPAVSPFASSRPTPPPVPPPIAGRSRHSVPPPVATHRVIAPPEPPPLPDELSDQPSRVLSLIRYSLLTAVLVMAGVTGKALWDNADGLKQPHANSAVTLGTTHKPTQHIRAAKAASPASQSDTGVRILDHTISMDTVSTLDSLPVDDELAALPNEVETDTLTLNDELDALPTDSTVSADTTSEEAETQNAHVELVSYSSKTSSLPIDLQSVAKLAELPKSVEEVNATEVASVAEEKSVSSTECADGTCSAPSDDLIAADEENADAMCVDGKCSTPRTLGTLVNWAPTAERAAEMASKDNKLVFLMQVSGNFAREEFT